MTALTAKDYCPTLRADWSVKSEILKRVNRESECTVMIETPPLPKYEAKEKEKWSPASIRAFAHGMLP